MRRILAVMIAGIATAANAQPQPDIAMLSKALGILQEQRDSANNAIVNSEARARVLAEENDNLRAQVKQLQEDLAKARESAGKEQGQ